MTQRVQMRVLILKGTAKINTAIKSAREKARLMQTKAAEKATLTERMYQHYEAGTRVPNAYTAVRLAKALNTTVEELFTVADDKNS